jgi:hypothetical protein
MKKWVSATNLALIVATSALFAVVSLAAGQAPAAPPQGRGGAGAGAGQRGGGAGRGAAAPAPPAGPFTRTPEGTPDLNGYWGGCCNLGLQDLETQRGIIVDPTPAKIPYNAEYAAKAKDLRANHMFDEPGLHCLLNGVPFQMYTQFGFQILAKPKQVLLTWDFMGSNRVIPLDGRPHIPESMKLFMGDPVGHWEGDVLVVETTNLNDRTWLDAVGHLHSDSIHVIERFTPVDANTIRYEATVTDPKAFTQPMKLQDTFRRNTKAGYEQLEFACVEHGDTDLEHYTEAAGAPPKAK